MKTFYSLIKISPNPISGDSISIGLLVRDSSKFWLHFSDEKKLLAKRLLEKKADVVDFIIKQLTQKVSLANKEISNPQTSFFDLHDFINSEKALHMSVYFNGIVRFSQPSFLNDTINNVKFEKLFQLLIDKTFYKEKPADDLTDLKFQRKITDKLINRVVNKVHTDLELTPDKLPGLYFNFNIDCIGKNGVLIGAKSIPFHRKHETIDKELGHYFGLISILKSQYKSSDSIDNFYIIADEPSEIASKEHKIWESLTQNPSITLLDSDMSGIVADEIEKRHAKTFLPPLLYP